MLFKKFICSILFLLLTIAHAQETPKLDVKTIMQDPELWIGSLPENPYWSEDGKSIYFSWNPENADSDSLYTIPLRGGKAQKVSAKTLAQLPAQYGEYSIDKRFKIFAKNGDIFFFDIKKSRLEHITRTLATESNPRFSQDQKRIIFQRGYALFEWRRKTGKIRQILEIKATEKPKEDHSPTDPQEKYIQSQELELMQVLRQRKEKQQRKTEYRKKMNHAIPTFYTGKFRLGDIRLSPNEKYVTLNLSDSETPGKSTKVPRYITEDGYTTTKNSRSKVGSKQRQYRLAIIDIKKDTLIFVSTDSLPGIDDFPEFTVQKKKDGNKRTVDIWGPFWSHRSNQAFV